MRSHEVFFLAKWLRRLLKQTRDACVIRCAIVGNMEQPVSATVPGILKDTYRARCLFINNNSTFTWSHLTLKSAWWGEWCDVTCICAIRSMFRSRLSPAISVPVASHETATTFKFKTNSCAKKREGRLQHLHSPSLCCFSACAPCFTDRRA